MNAVKLALLCALLVAASGVASAAGFEKGSSLFAVQLSEGVADLVDPTGAGNYISAYDHSELGVQAQYWYFLKDEYALNLSGGIGFFSEINKPGQNAAPGATDFKYTQTSWQVRVGGDRVAKINDRFHIFAGPGIQLWSGKAKFDGGPSFTPALESKNVMRWALEGRIGMHIALSEQAGLFGQLGHYVGYASVTDKGSKATWWPSGHDGAIGFALAF